MFKKILVSAGMLALALLLLFLLIVENQGTSGPQNPRKKWGTLSYLNWTPAGNTINKAGVVTFDRHRAYPGFNLYCSKHSFSAHLLDMQGRLVHRWAKKTGRTDFWHHVQMCKNGGLLVMVKDKMLMRLDRDSKVRWICRLRCHHDVSLSDSGDIYVIARRDSFVVRHGLPVPLLQDYLVILSPDGTVKREIAVYPLVKEEIGDERFLRIYRWLQEPSSLQECRSRKREKGYYLRMDTPVDLLHTNSLEVVGREIPGVCRQGDLLISVRELDPVSRDIVWEFYNPHLKKKKKKRATIYRMVRIVDTHHLSWLKGPAARRFSR